MTLIDSERVSVDHTLAATHLKLAYGDRVIVDDLSVTLPSGQVTVIIGGNGCGKSTLLRGLARLLPPSAGAVLLDGRSLQSMPTKEVAKVLGLLPQAPVAPEGITVSELVGRGRYPHQGWFRQWDGRRRPSRISGPGRDRHLGARRPADRGHEWRAATTGLDRHGAGPGDRPTPPRRADTYLDLSHQVEVLDLLTDLNRRLGTTIVIVMHDLNLACRYADHLIAMRDGSIVVQGAPHEVITADTIRRVFDMTATIIDDPVSGTPTVIPIGRHHCAPTRE